MRLIEEEMGLKRRRIMRIYKGSKVYRISLSNVENYNVEKYNVGNYNYQLSYLQDNQKSNQNIEENLESNKQTNYLQILAWSIFVSLVITRMILFLFYSEGFTNPFDVFIYDINRDDLFSSFVTTFIFALITTAISPFLINSIKWRVLDLFLVSLISTFFFWLLPTLFSIGFFIYLPLTLIFLVKWILKNAS
jgi:hypothetical protein